MSDLETMDCEELLDLLKLRARQLKATEADLVGERTRVYELERSVTELKDQIDNITHWLKIRAAS